MKKKAIVFDFDGTLCDSLPFVGRIVTEAISMFRTEPLTSEEEKKIQGPTEEGIINYLVEDKGKAKECYLRYLEKYSEGHDEYLGEFFPGIRNLLDDLLKRNVTLFLLTGRSKETTSISLAKLGAYKYFKAIYTGGIKGEVKDILLKELCSDFSLEAKDLFYIGDSTHDVSQCERVGVDILSVSYTNPSSFEKLEKINKGNVVTSVKELKERIDSYIWNPCKTPLFYE